jgi:acetyltransferase-like isoleucine patch superfamily enzyme
MSFAATIKSNSTLKQIVHWLLIPSHQAKPRKWVSWFVNPLIHKRGKGVTICKHTRMDLLPFNPFSIGDYSTIEDFATVNNGVGEVSIGEHTRIGLGNVIIGPVSIGSHVIFAQNIVLSGLNHRYEDVETPISKQPVTVANITIEDECWIGANVVITAGVTVGKHSVVAAGAVVTKNIPPYSIAVGNPAKVIKQYNSKTKEWERV